MNKKKISALVVVLLIITFACFFVYEHLTKRKNPLWVTPPPTLPLVKTSKETNGKSMQLSFPTFHISLRVPKDLKTIKELDPTAEGTLVGANYIAFFTPNSVIDTKKHLQTAGAKLSINVASTRNGFTDKKDIVPTKTIKKAETDETVIPANNPLLNKDNTRVLLFPLDKSSHVWSYYVEALIKNEGTTLHPTFYCTDYSYNKDDSTCQKLLKYVLPTILVK